MSLEQTLKDLINDVEKLKAVGQESDILEEITLFSIDATVAPVMSCDKNSFAFTETTEIALTVRGTNNFEANPTCATVLECVEQDAGTFVIGTARIGFADIG